jgi:hypothetical protein
MKNKLQLLDRSECLTLLSTRASSFWSRINFVLNFPLVITSSAMCIINSISDDGNQVKIPNIVVNAISVLMMSIINNIKAGEKYDNFKRLSQLFLELAQEIDSIEGDQIDIDKYNMLVLKYDNLIRSCDFEHIPANIKTEVSMLFQKNNKHIPIQLNGTIGGFKRNSGRIEMSSELV